jgi:hypothetical protein
MRRATSDATRLYPVKEPEMKTAIAILAAAACAQETPTKFTDGGEDMPAVPGVLESWTFDDEAQGTLPGDFAEVLGDWRVEQGELHQRGEYGGPDFPRVILRHLTYADATVRVRCFLESGETDQACGLMFRVVDSENYLLTRANALEDNVRLYRIVDGNRQQFASASLEVTSRAWHELEVTMDGAELRVAWNGTEVLSASDATFTNGKVGLWTKADAITRFDDLEAMAAEAE